MVGSDNGVKEQETTPPKGDKKQYASKRVNTFHIREW